MDFGKVLTRAGEIIWKHKVLWIFGILAGCGAQGGNTGSRFSFDGGNFDSGNRPFGEMPQFDFGVLDSRIWVMIVIALFIVLVIGLLFFALGVYGRLGLIRGTLMAEAGEPIIFGDVHTAAMPFLGRSLLLNLVLALLFLVVGLAFAAIAVVGTVATFGLALLCIIPLACLLVPVFWFVSIWIEQANVALVAEDLPVAEALRRGWEVVRANPGESIGMGLILLIGGGVAQFIIGLPLLFVIAPVMASLFAFSADPNSAFGWGGLGVAALCFVVFMPVLLVAMGVIQSYVKSAWTLTFMQLRQRINPSAGEPLPDGL